MKATIAAIETGFPPRLAQQDACNRFFSRHYGHSRVARRIWRNAGVSFRHAAVDPAVEDLSSVPTSIRMKRFVDEDVPVGKSALEECSRSALAAADVGLFASSPRTGCSTPGVDILFARDLGMAATVRRLHIGHMGCYAAPAALAALSDAAVARGNREGRGS